MHMKIINANAEYIDPKGVHPYKFMERIGRICYKSEDKITEDSAVKFVNRLFQSKHTAMLEHSHVIMSADPNMLSRVEIAIAPVSTKIKNSTITYPTPVSNFLNITIDELNNKGYISASFRSLIELVEIFNNDTDIMTIGSCLADEYPEIFSSLVERNRVSYENSIKILSRDEFIKDIRNTYTGSNMAEYNNVADSIISKHLTHTVIFTCDRGVSHEFVRHRPASFAQESTRYCNYNQNKFGSEITVIRPCVWSEEAIANDKTGALENLFNTWKSGCKFAEKMYFELINNGAPAQLARDVLPTSVKTELAITATESEWKHIINLRLRGTTGAPHPQMVEVMKIAYPMLVDASDIRLADPCDKEIKA